MKVGQYVMEHEFQVALLVVQFQAIVLFSHTGTHQCFVAFLVLFCFGKCVVLRHLLKLSDTGADGLPCWSNKWLFDFVLHQWVSRAPG